MTISTTILTQSNAVDAAETGDTVDADEVSEAATPLLVCRNAGQSKLRRVAERGMISAEWAVGIIAAIAIAGVLIAVVTNGNVEDALLDVIVKILKSIVEKL